ncbi:hypothetical protein [Acinetobacter nematophilus]|uniref:Uncharacterized protein n=1 Tax=Acinetobacter nematophilus TaxID=2994642 RepID=A0A9X3DSY9_9GAMM|nr:hypothetical protein [Acinetobacter nematophilus]MCX5466832.1 hypothetical protein [Acinetobacter nematophilus]
MQNLFNTSALMSSALSTQSFQFKTFSALVLLCTFTLMSVPSYADETTSTMQTVQNRVELGGAVRMRFDYDPDRDTRKLSFDTAILNLDFYHDQFSGHIEHRFLGGAYPYEYTEHIGDVNFAKKAYLEYAVDPQQSIQVGLNQVPIGIQPYYTSTVIESLAYIAGIEDLYRVGAKYHYKQDNYDVYAAYYASNPWKGKGTSQGAYYSNQIIPADESLDNGTSYKEHDAVALQYNYSHQSGNWLSNYGISGYYARLKSKLIEDKDGHRGIYALHYGINKDRLGLKFVSLFNHIDTPYDQTTFGAYDGTFNVANKGILYSLDLNYKIPEFNVKDVHDFNVYMHYSLYDKSKKAFLDSNQLVFGSAFTYKKNLYIAAEWLFGKNSPYIGGSSYSQSLAAGGSNQWENQVNVNIGYYF